MSLTAGTAHLAAVPPGVDAPPPVGLRPPLWCFAGGGSPALALLPIARELPPNQSVHALQAHGFEGKDWPDWSVAGAARRHLREIQAKAPVGPYPLLGHSFGGLVAFEVARQLTEQGHQVPFVMLLDTLLPRSVANPTGPRERARAALGGDLEMTAGPVQPLASSPDTADQGSADQNPADQSPADQSPADQSPADQSPADQSSAATPPPPWRRRWQMHRRVAGAGLIGYPAAIRDEVFWERSLRMANRYRPEPWSGRVVLIVAEHNQDDLARWAAIATGELDVLRVPGGHSSILRSPFNAPVVQRLRDELEAASGNTLTPGKMPVSSSFSP